jgi:anti-sigma B factor antagonist
MQLVVDVDELEGAVVVRASGEVDLGSAPRLRDVAVDRLLAGDRLLVLDLSAVEFIDSIGLGTLVAILKRARSLGGDVSLVVTDERVRRPIELTGLHTAFTVHPDLPAALAAARSTARSTAP